VGHLAHEPDAALLGLRQGRAERVDVGGEFGEFGLGGHRHAGVVLPARHPAGRRTHAPQRVGHADRGQDPEHGGHDDTHEAPQDQRLVDREGELVAQARARRLAPAALTALHLGAPQGLVEEGRGEQPHDEEGRQATQHGHKHVGQDQPRRQGPHAGLGRNL